MQPAAQSFQEIQSTNPEHVSIITTLYELIEAISEELQPGEEELLGRIVLDLAENHRIRYFRNYREART